MDRHTSNFDLTSPEWPMLSSDRLLTELYSNTRVLMERTEQHRLGSEARMKDMKDHLDGRIDELKVDLRQDISGVHQRIDRLEDRVTANGTMKPWWKDASPKELMTWAALIITGLIAIREPTLATGLIERLIGTVAK